MSYSLRQTPARAVRLPLSRLDGDYRGWLCLLAVIVAVYAPLLNAGTANAASLQAAELAQAASLRTAQTTGGQGYCDPASGFCPQYPPPPLLNSDYWALGLDGGLYVATPAQVQSLHNLEGRAVKNVLLMHSLSDADIAAVQTWGRTEATGELYALLISAIYSTNRSADEQNAVDWLTTIAQRRSVEAAQNAGREYVKWAGLDQNAFESLLQTQPSQSTLQSFLSGTPLNYNNANPAQATGGWCAYRAPDPDSAEYTGYNDVTCKNPCPLGSATCNPPTPTYEQFVRWGEAYSAYKWMNGADFGSDATSLALVLGMSLPFASLVTLTGTTGYLIVAAMASDAAWAATSAALVEAGAGTAAGAGAEASAVSTIAPIAGAWGGLTVGIVLTALTTAILEGYNAITAAALPGKLATLIANTQSTPPDLKLMLDKSDGATTMFSYFVGATEPSPVNYACDNSDPTRLPPGVSVSGSTGLIQLAGQAPCLNPTRIPGASSTDPQFLVQAKGATTQTLSPTITWKNSDATVTTARLSKNWFVTQSNGSTAQKLTIRYTDWAGKQQNAWLLGDPSEGYTFVNYTPPSDATKVVKPSTCVTDGYCSSGDSINFIGSDGKGYSAKVRGYQAPTGTPKFTTAVEGQPLSFDANGFAPGGATGAITYQWRFQDEGCGMPCANNVEGVEYGDPVSGAAVTHTWHVTGAYVVELTATDSVGATGSTTFTVSVGNVPPALSLWPCPAPGVIHVPGPCSQTSGDTGASVELAGTFYDPGTLSNLTITINWGDGTSDSTTIGPNSPVVIVVGVTNPIALNINTSGPGYTFDARHTYTTPATFDGTILVTDGIAGASQPFAMKIGGLSLQTIDFPAVAAHTYGDAPVAVSATANSGLPVTFAVTGDASVCSVSNGAVTLLKAGTCAITASQSGNAAFGSAPQVTRSFTVSPAPLQVTASSPMVSYQAAVPAITPSYSGFVNQETASVLNPQATCAVANLPSTGVPGTYQTTCNGAADPNYTISYVVGALTIGKVPVTVTASSATIAYGAALPTVTPSYSGFINNDGPSVIDTAPKCSNSVGGSVAPGTYKTQCILAADAIYGFTYVPGTLTINKAATSLTLSASQTSVTQGQSVTVTASFSGLIQVARKPSGVVTFTDGSASLCLTTVDPNSGTATCTATISTGGTHTISARYAGDANYLAGTAPALSLAVNAKPTTVSVGAPNVLGGPTYGVPSGANVTFSASVDGGGNGLPTGTVTFFDGTTQLGTGQVQPVSGKLQPAATLTTRTLAIGHHSITASYSGDANFSASTTTGLDYYISINVSSLPAVPNGTYRVQNMPGTIFAGLNLQLAQVLGDLTNAIFVGTDLSTTMMSGNFAGADFSHARLYNADMVGSHFEHANFTGADLTFAGLSSANLTGAIGLKTATLTNANWSSTVCPDGTNSNQDGGTCIGHL